MKAQELTHLETLRKERREAAESHLQLHVKRRNGHDISDTTLWMSGRNITSLNTLIDFIETEGLDA